VQIVRALGGQVQIVRREPVADWEHTLLTAAVWALDRGTPPAGADPR
jgi:hypothetical protein